LDAEVGVIAPPSAADASPRSVEAMQLQVRLQTLLLKIKARTQQTPSPAQGSRPITPDTSPTMPPPQAVGQAPPQAVPDKGAKPPPEAVEPVNALSLAEALFQAGNYEQSLKAYRTIDLTGMKADDRAPIQYLTATCLRKLGKTEEAATLYREVANSRGDEQVASCAQWQLNMLRWRRDWEVRLQAARERRQSLEKMP
jgi:tetratricopeptide (TPR) repeat protein